MSGQDPFALAEWQRIRRYAVPDQMITECTEARERGDWRAACEAGGVDVLIDDPAPVAEQLAGFAPDLLRWHIPRVLGGHTTVAAGQRYVLVGHDVVIGPDSVVLIVESPVSALGSQRLTLRTVRWGDQPGGEVLPIAAHLWDARHAGELRTALSGSADRLPGFTPSGAALWSAPSGDLRGYAPSADLRGSASSHAAPGFADSGDDLPARAERVRRQTTIPAGFAEAGAEVLGDWPPHDRAWTVDAMRVVHDARALTARFGSGEWALQIDYRKFLHIAVDGDTVRVRWQTLTWSDQDSPVRRLNRIDGGLTRFAVDLDLIRNGRLTAGQLHPLVRAALFPGVPTAPASQVPATHAEPVRVRCSGAWHEIGVQRGLLTLPAHTEAERMREKAMRAFGGAVTGCFAVEQTWAGTAGRLPKRLRAHREDLWQRMLHGGTRTVLELLDAGMDPNLRDSRGRTLMHRLRSYDHRVLLPRLLAEGLDINARDLEGSTPLYLAVVYQVPADLIIALSDAGADPHAPNQDDMTVFDYFDDVLEYRDDLEPEFAAAVAHIRRRA
ncbi:ankyrin repeat domain-containing protein [Actinoplanes derwentensis]|uniref:Uncharacterized protein n=1 Tax=Actinoplanes derwentensis TaxID=113562 RepID=A0A1H1U2S1_9ACTN|nr:ankyrin repeat domain-containing protein [Actinoplanes derwentensis]GID85166.1 hypothetical protein Ade03nite_40900 [Actinoplanes derwentensis]SDS66209.1 hypothetical protein SAMN04489716_1302 [Actinoplanes derwentensis]